MNQTDQCGAYYGTGLPNPNGAATCRRPAGHPSVAEDGIGHSPSSTLPNDRLRSCEATSYSGKPCYMKVAPPRLTCMDHGLHEEPSPLPGVRQLLNDALAEIDWEDYGAAATNIQSALGLLEDM